MTIRPETPGDRRAVEELTREAFWNIYRPGCVEHLVVHNLRSDENFVPELDYVVEEDGKLIASIFYARARVEEDWEHYHDILIFGPVSVLPEYQGKGYGSALIHFTLNKARELGCPLVAITGSPDYYSRFGFEPAASHGIFYAGMDPEEETPFFIVKVLDEEKAAAIKGGYSDPLVYLVDDQEVEEFDRSFPPKQKEVRDSQLF